ncbi:MAG: hypothetical protein HY593_02520, partial [Candidatus Omnitrophica bacterium]|nr:hypothetical protein [Candidatus Omnitrophota bacterium]
MFGGYSEYVCACHGIRLSVAWTARNQCGPQRLDAPCERTAVAAHLSEKVERVYFTSMILLAYDTSGDILSMALYKGPERL